MLVFTQAGHEVVLRGGLQIWQCDRLRMCDMETYAELIIFGDSGTGKGSSLGADTQAIYKGM